MTFDRNKALANTMRNFGFPKKFSEITKDDFKASPIRIVEGLDMELTQMELKSRLEEFVLDTPLFLCGPVGTGKTMLASYLAKRFIDEVWLPSKFKSESIHPLFFLANRLADFVFTDKLDADSLWLRKLLFISPFLVIDDITKIPETNKYLIGLLDSILRERWHNDLMTIVTSNVPLSWIADLIAKDKGATTVGKMYGNSIEDIFKDYDALLIAGESRRGN